MTDNSPAPSKKAQFPLECPECGFTLQDRKHARQHARSHWGLGAGTILPSALEGEALRRYQILHGEDA